MLITDMVKLPIHATLVGFIIVFNFFTDIAFLNSLQQKITRNISIVEQIGFLHCSKENTP